MTEIDEAAVELRPHRVAEAQVPGSRLLGCSLAWREAMEIADAHRTRLRNAVLDDIAAGLSVTAASQLTGLSRVTLHKWLRER